LTNYHSESLRKAASTYKDIEYCKSSLIIPSRRLKSSQGVGRKSVGWSITRRPGRDRGITSKRNDEDPKSPSSDGRIGYSRANRMGSCSPKAKDGEGSLGERLV
jgi:hypothetical protein